MTVYAPFAPVVAAATGNPLSLVAGTTSTVTPGNRSMS